MLVVKLLKLTFEIVVCYLLFYSRYWLLSAVVVCDCGVDGGGDLLCYGLYARSWGFAFMADVAGRWILGHFTSSRSGMGLCAVLGHR